jgi:hypothetical protein
MQFYLILRHNKVVRTHLECILLFTGTMGKYIDFASQSLCKKNAVMTLEVVLDRISGTTYILTHQAS